MGRSARKHDKASVNKSNKLLDNIWAQLKDGAESIYKGESMSSQKYMILYSCIYNYCTNVQMKIPTIPTKPTNSGKKGTVIGAQVLGLELYTRISNFIENYLNELCKVLIHFSFYFFPHFFFVFVLVKIQ